MNRIADTKDRKVDMRRMLAALKEARAKLEAAERSRTEPIAIVGAGCRFPGGADSPESFWRLLIDRVDTVSEIPRGRWLVDDYYDPVPGVPGKMYFRNGAFVEGIDMFDPHFFGISPREAASMDPQHRLLLEVSWEALENAAIAPDSLRNTRTGIFVGIGQNDYARLGSASGDPAWIDAYWGTGNLFCFAPGRLAHILGLQGPNMAVDTACSSSLAAVHLACASLRAGESDLALAGGSHLMISPEVSLFLSMTRAVSPDGRSRTFDAGADGFGRGEGCGVVALKRLSDALADRNAVLAVIRGSAINHDGPGSGLTVPSEKAQAQVIDLALKNAKVEPWELSHVEAHGTGTVLGDPIEINALAEALCRNRSANDPLIIGSVKANIGHLEAAAGVAGLIKAALSVKHGVIPPQLHFKTPNPLIPWDRLPLTVPTEALPWPGGKRRLAGVSSFGMSGVNVHMIVEEPPADAPEGPSVVPPLHALTLSAKTKDALEQLAGRYAERLSAHPDMNPADICYTANTGRALFDHRLFIIGSTTRELTDKLRGLAAKPEPGEVLIGQCENRAGNSLKFEPPAEADDWREALTKLGAAHVRGASVDWAHFYRDRGRRPVALPTYPFERQRCWVDPAQDRTSKLDRLQESGAIAGIPILPGRRIALPFSREIRFETSFSPDAPAYMNDHRIFGKIVVSAASHISMVLSGVKAALGQNACDLEDIVFSRAMILFTETPRRVQLILTPLEDREFSFRILSRKPEEEVDPLESGEDAAWTSHVTGTVRIPLEKSHSEADQALYPVDPMATAAPGRITLYGPEFHTDLSETALEFGRSFQWTERFYLDESEGLCEMKPPRPSEAPGDYQLHPGLIDGCFQLLSHLQHPDIFHRSDQICAPFRISGFRFYDSPTDGQAFRCRARIGNDHTELCLTDERGRRVAEITGVEFKLTGADALLKRTGEDADDWLYDINWIPESPVRRASPEEPGRWLIFADQKGLGVQAAEFLRTDDGAGCALVFPGKAYAHPETDHHHINPLDPGDYHRLLKETGPFRGIVWMWSLDAIFSPLDSPVSLLESPSRILLHSGSVLYLAQALVRTDWSCRDGLWIVTRGAQAVEPESRAPGFCQSPLWGLASVIGLEYPGLGCTCLDLDPGDPSGEIPALIETLLGDPGGSRIAIRGGAHYSSRLKRRTAGIPRTRPFIKKDGSYLISGGLGALGLRVAEMIASRGARRISLIGRSAPSNTALKAIRTIERTGAEVRVFKADISNREAVREALDAIASEGPALRGVVHTAGNIEDAVLAAQNVESFKRVMAPKIEGAWHLHTLTRDAPLDFFVCFSSMAGIVGAVGQGNYAAANAFLDALAHYRRSLGLPGLSIAWGPWAEAGMAAGLEDRERAAMTERGMEFLAPDQALEILERLIREGATHAVAARVNWSKFAERLHGNGPRRFFEAVVPSAAAPGQGASDFPTRAAHGLSRRLAETPRDRRRSVLMAHIRSRIAETLGLNPSEYFIEPRDGLLDLGIDSIMAIELKERLESDLERGLPATLVFDYSTLEGLADYLLGNAPAPAFPEATEPTPSRDDDLITFFSEVDGMSEDEVRDKFSNK